MVDLKSKLARLFTGSHAGVYRLTDGRVGADMGGARVLLLTTRGRRSGKPRTTPLMRVEHRGKLHVVASAAGADSHPAWFTNLSIEPRVGVHDGADRYVARAVVLDGPDRDAAFAAAIATMEGFAEYQRKTGRTIPVVRLDPIADVGR